MTDKIDFKKTLDSYQASRNTFRVLDVPEMRYLMTDGHGDPNTDPAFTEAVETLYPLAYKLKFASKRDLGRDYVVPPLEGLWWADDMDSFTVAHDKSAWNWTLMLMVPDWIDDDLVALVALEKNVRLETLSEGRCVQTLHVGPFSGEAEVLERMHREFTPGDGRHHEIYLSDVRKTAEDKRRTILRQPLLVEGGQ